MKKRPHLHEFMDRVATMFEVVVFTASQKVYAEKLLNVIDPKRNLIKHRVYRDSCVMVDGNYLKVRIQDWAWTEWGGIGRGVGGTVTG